MLRMLQFKHHVDVCPIHILSGSQISNKVLTEILLLYKLNAPGAYESSNKETYLFILSWIYLKTIYVLHVNIRKHHMYAANSQCNLFKKKCSILFRMTFTLKTQIVC